MWKMCIFSRLGLSRFEICQKQTLSPYLTCLYTNVWKIFIFSKLKHFWIEICEKDTFYPF